MNLGAGFVDMDVLEATEQMAQAPDCKHVHGREGAHPLAVETADAGGGSNCIYQPCELVVYGMTEAVHRARLVGCLLRTFLPAELTRVLGVDTDTTQYSKTGKLNARVHCLQQ